MNRLAITIYRLMEKLDGENGIRIIGYKIATRVKLYCLNFIN